MNIILVDQINVKDNPIGRFFELLVFGKLWKCWYKFEVWTVLLFFGPLHLEMFKDRTYLVNIQNKEISTQIEN